MKKEKISETRKKIISIYEENELANLQANKNRARSVTVGTAFGGAVELSMRGDYASLWAVMQPVEVVELIEQLASGVGLQVAMRPRQDFASWRGWNTDAEHRYWAGAGQWQIEQAAHSHKKMMEEFYEEEQKLLTGESNNEELTKKNTAKKKSKKYRRIKKNMDLQQKVADDLMRPGLENLDKLREGVKEDHQKYLDEVNPPDN